MSTLVTATSLALLALACSSDAKTTGAVVVVSAEPSIAADTTSLVLRVYGSDGTTANAGTVLREERTIPIGASATLPYSLAIAPLGGDETRIYRVEIEARDSTGGLIATTKVVSGFAPGRVIRIDLVFDDACRGVVCSDAGLTCKAAVCVDAHVDPTTLPTYGHDAGVAMDAGADAETDAGPTDGGSIVCSSGFVLTGGNCVDVDECATNHGGCDVLSSCTNDVGTFACGPCPSGYSGTGATGCTDIDECATNNGGCDAQTSCTNSAGGFTCGACPSGYTGTGATGCTDVDECASSNGGCDARTSCTNTVGSRQCGACPSGFTGTGETGCVDDDECATNHGGCDPVAPCNNSPGSFSCGACPTGYTGTGATACVDVDECATNNGGCDARTTCTNTLGDRTCSACPAGFSGTGDTACVDTNECMTGNGGCDSNAICTNTTGSRDCACMPGYAGDGLSCTNVDDCAGLPCQNGGTCVDGVSSYTCNCTAEWTGPECATNVDDCAPNPCMNAGTCVDGIGVYSCTCPSGYTGTNCETVVSSCASTPCVHGTCMDTGPGTYLCTCDSVWQGVNCDTPADACVPTNPCQNGGTCASTGPGTYSCSCPNGWTGTDCGMDVDECATNNGGCASGVTCTNTLGSRTCGACPSGYVGDGVTCTPVNCGAPPTVANATVAVSGGLGGGMTTTANATATYTCATGFTQTGSGIVCSVGGAWTGTLPTCTAVASFCPAPTAIANDVVGSPTVSGGAAGGTTTSYGATATYVCAAGYGLTGTNPTCQANMSWSATPSCTITSNYCPTLSNPSNGSVAISGGIGGGSTRSLNATATYSCGSGFSLSGSATRTCQSGGTWSGSAPTCVDIDECTLGTDTCDNSPAATCTNTSGGYTCTCPSGYAGTGSPSGTVCSDINECTQGTDLCDDSPAATCTNTTGSYVCSCPAGYTPAGTPSGSICNDYNECASNNGGCHALTTCINTTGSRWCSACPAGYYGTGLSTCISGTNACGYPTYPMPGTSGHSFNYQTTTNTVRDMVTGLEWQRDTPATLYTQANAITYCNNLSLGGQTDWRLPTRTELVTLVNYATDPPYSSSFTNGQANSYWTSQASVGNATHGHVVDFYIGWADGFRPNTDTLPVRCVR